MEPPNTKTQIASAFEALVATKPADKITVRAIAAKAGVSERAFYNHFENKTALIVWVFAQQVWRCAESTIYAGGSYYDFQLQCFKVMASKSDYARNIWLNMRGRDSCREPYCNALVEILLHVLEQRHGAAMITDRIRFKLLFFMRASLAAMFDWQMGGRVVSTEEMARRIVACMPARLAELFDTACVHSHCQNNASCTVNPSKHGRYVRIVPHPAYTADTF